MAVDGHARVGIVRSARRRVPHQRTRRHTAAGGRRRTVLRPGGVNSSGVLDLRYLLSVFAFRRGRALRRLGRLGPRGFGLSNVGPAGRRRLPVGRGGQAGAGLGGLIVMYDTQRRNRRIQEGQVKIEDMEPEDRLPLAMVGGVGFAATMFWLAWSAEYK